MLGFWNSLELVSKIGSFSQLMIVIFSIILFVFRARGTTLQKIADQEARDQIVRRVHEEIRDAQPTRAKILLSKQQSIPPNVRTRANFDKIIYQTQDGFWYHEGSGWFERSAIYGLTLSVRIQEVPENIEVTLTVESSNETFTRKFNVSEFGNPLVITEKSFDVDSGDTIGVFIEHNSNRDIVVSAASDQTFVKIEEVERRDSRE